MRPCRTIEKRDELLDVESGEARAPRRTDESHALADLDRERVRLPEPDLTDAEATVALELVDATLGPLDLDPNGGLVATGIPTLRAAQGRQRGVGVPLQVVPDGQSRTAAAPPENSGELQTVPCATVPWTLSVNGLNEVVKYPSM